jgi:hypothetical protein
MENVQEKTARETKAQDLFILLFVFLKKVNKLKRRFAKATINTRVFLISKEVMLI